MRSPVQPLMRTATCAVVLAIALAAHSAGARAQTLNASEPAIVSQVVDGTKVTVEYSRPRARGRTGLFGTEVRFDHTWTPGANQSTTLALNKDVTINRHPVAKGKYSVWMVVARGDWEVVLDHDTTLYHTNPPSRRPDQVRFMIPREHHPFTEVLTWAFPVVGTSSMVLTMQWDTVSVPLSIKVTPTFTTAVPRDAAQRVAGTYRWHDAANQPGMDSAAHPASAFTVRYAGGELHARLDPPLFGDPSYGEYVLIQKKGDLYSFGRIDRGELIEVIDYCTLQFSPANGQPKAFEVRGTDDALWANGTVAP
jgi:Protein of unknown function (DUF2911)